MDVVSSWVHILVGNQAKHVSIIIILSFCTRIWCEWASHTHGTTHRNLLSSTKLSIHDDQACPLCCLQMIMECWKISSELTSMTDIKDHLDNSPVIWPTIMSTSDGDLHQWKATYKILTSLKYPNQYLCNERQQHLPAESCR